MDNTLLKGIWKYMLPVPPFLWQSNMRKMAEKARLKIGFMEADHHLVRNFAVKELSRAGAPLPPESIAQGVNLDVDML